MVLLLMLIASIIKNASGKKKLKTLPLNSLFKDLTLQRGKLRTHSTPLENIH